jgi:hypothetical protein
MENKIDLLKQLGFSDELISIIVKEDSFSIVNEDQSNSDIDCLPTSPLDTGNIIIEKTDRPQSVFYLINQA